MNDPDGEADQSRRRFLGSFAAGAIASVSATTVGASEDRNVDKPWDAEVDILVVGGGAAGCSAAVTAHELKNRVMVIEKAPVLGGTAAKSVGGIWVPDNRFMRHAGIADNRADCLRYMVRLSFADRYNPAINGYGADPLAYRQMQTYYDNANRVVETLGRYGALKLSALKAEDQFMPDYFAHLPENKVPAGRTLVTAREDGSPGNGAEMMERFARAVNSRRIPVKKRCRARELIRDQSGAVTGLIAQMRDGSLYRIRASKGVIFATGGFTHNQQMRRNFLKGPVFGGCAVPSCEGDFVDIGTKAGARLANMNNAWLAQLPVEQALANSSVPSGIWCIPGDSMIQVNRKGVRFVDEKFSYNERALAHFEWDPVSASYPNLLSFMIYDQRTADQFAGFTPIPPKGADADYLIRGTTLKELGNQIEQRLEKIKSETGGFSLNAGFTENLMSTIEQFNQYAKIGVDEDFSRGAQPIDRFFHYFGPGKPKNTFPNVTMHPFSETGQYYCIILAAGTLDTKGGPVTNEFGQVLDTEGLPISGLYGAGNCIASCSGPAYWAGGATLGPAMTFGSLAAEHASRSTLSL